ncbi:MAG: hypothetical protein IPL28_12290 [Chloroflexi bacterium]|nr:hypothetical protein [Chloroflexota bacterium]
MISYSACTKCARRYTVGAARVAARVEGEIPDVLMIGIPGALVNFVPIDFL